MNNARRVTWKVVASLLAVSLSSSASAEWSRIAHNASTSTYVDKNTKKRVGNSGTVWVLSDFIALQNPNGLARFHSFSSLVEFDCTQKLSRALYTDVFSGQMGVGSVVKSSKGEPPEEWSRPRSNSADELILQYVCR